MIIFSLDTKEYTAKNADIQALNDDLSDLVQAQGCYKGQTERSFVAEYNQFKEVLEYAKQYNQESILLIKPNYVSLYYVDSGEELEIGTEFKAVSKEVALAQDAYTKLNGMYYIVV